MKVKINCAFQNHIKGFGTICMIGVTNPFCNMKECTVGKDILDSLRKARLTKKKERDVDETDIAQVIKKSPSDQNVDFEIIPEDELHISYICDRKRECGKNGCGECNYTDDIKHTANFIKIMDGLFMEKETKPIDESYDGKKRLVYDMPKFVNECSYAFGKATRMDCDYFECSLDKKECISTSYCRHFEKFKPYTPEQYEIEAMRTVDGALPTEKRLLEGLVGMNSEAGEALDIWKKHKFHGHDLDKEAIALELGDALWYLTEAADALGYSLEEVMKMNIKKLQERYPDGFDPERSKHRKEGDK